MADYDQVTTETLFRLRDLVSSELTIQRGYAGGLEVDIAALEHRLRAINEEISRRGETFIPLSIPLNNLI